MNRLESRVAIITGGASGIGEAMARLFVSEGASVLIADVQDRKGRELMETLGTRASYIHADVSVEGDVEAAIAVTLSEYGRLDCMFNNAGIAGPTGLIESVTVEEFDEAVAVLLRGVFLGIKHAAPVMKQQGRGSIINTASIAGLRTGYGNHIYSAAKAGVIQLTRSVAMELGESGVRVNCILPGFIPTPMIGRARGLTIEEADDKLEEIKEVFTDAQPLKRPGLPEDIAKAALWLATDESSFVNGHALVVDGGVSGGRMWSDYQEALESLRETLGLDQ
ncbi:MAG: glucose 1-dehydrogenase [Candidatus Bathyarchaeota archaeon]|jgi:NAD(P)-dependent dehydrogenase (short-subunit alcohol dehydrogenase family)